jgi:hypothetical protein
MQIKLSQIKHFDWQVAARGMCCSELIRFLPDSLFWDEWRFEFARLVQGWLMLLISSMSFSRSSREGF